MIFSIVELDLVEAMPLHREQPIMSHSTRCLRVLAISQAVLQFFCDRFGIALSFTLAGRFQLASVFFPPEHNGKMIE
jgi:hypothetical protein